MTPVERVFNASTEGPTVRPELGPCLDCSFATDRNGYPRVRVGSRVRIAGRVVLEHVLGRPIDEGKQANHHCDRASCIRPEHLYEGTQKQNVADAHARGRAAVNVQTGDQNGRTRLTQEAVRVIRLLAQRGVSNIRLARAHGVDRSTVWQIVQNRIWVYDETKHVAE